MKKINKSIIVYILLISIIITAILATIILNKRRVSFGDLIKNNYTGKNIEANVTDEANVYKYENGNINSKTYVKNITKENFQKLINVIEDNSKTYSIIEYIDLPDYTIEYTDGNNNDFQIDIRFTNFGMVLIKSSSEVIQIFEQNQIKEITNILDYNYEPLVLNYNTLDLINLKSPPDLYINNNIETRIFGYRWYDNFSGICGNTSFKEVIDDSNTIKNTNSLILSTNKEININMTKLPENIKLEYSIYEYDANSQLFSLKPIFKKEAIRTITGDYYLEKPDNLKGNFVYKISLSIADSDKTSVSYYFMYINN